MPGIKLGPGDITRKTIDMDPDLRGLMPKLRDEKQMDNYYIVQKSDECYGSTEKGPQPRHVGLGEAFVRR